MLRLLRGFERIRALGTHGMQPFICDTLRCDNNWEIANTLPSAPTNSEKIRALSVPVLSFRLVPSVAPKCSQSMMFRMASRRGFTGNWQSSIETPIVNIGLWAWVTMPSYRRELLAPYRNGTVSGAEKKTAKYVKVSIELTPSAKTEVVR
jgi:hypothetical protein